MKRKGTFLIVPLHGFLSPTMVFQKNSNITEALATPLQKFPDMKMKAWDFPSGPVVKTPCFQCRGCGFNTWLGNKDPTCHGVWTKKDFLKKEKKMKASTYNLG